MAAKLPDVLRIQEWEHPEPSFGEVKEVLALARLPLGSRLRGQPATREEAQRSLGPPSSSPPPPK